MENMNVDALKPLFEIKQVDVEYHLKDARFLALRDVDLEGFLGQTLGVVGESGCGKSTLAKTLMCINPPTHGRIFFDGTELTNLTPREQRKALRGMQMIFQDPDASLNPRMTVEAHIREAITTSKVQYEGTLNDYVLRLLDMVQLPHSALKMYSYQLSGGQKQRVSIARALSVKPKLLICDEPLSSLDVSVVAQIILLLKKIQEEQGLSYLFITHDLATLRYLAHRLLVLYLGRVMEFAPAQDLFNEPLHPYTQALMASIPIPDPQKHNEPAKLCIVGDPPSIVDPPSGCVFHTRCPFATEACRHIAPRLKELKPNHWVACHLYD
jgi:peptide/nickel transport system ATP-binding protein/oligopeptide transport system ATP-binding protein